MPHNQEPRSRLRTWRFVPGNTRETIATQQSNARLDDLAVQTPSTGGTLYYTAGSSLAVLAKGSSGQSLLQGTSEPFWGAPAPNFVSTGLAVASTSDTVAAHGLGAQPSRFSVTLQNIASTLGYSTGEEVDVGGVDHNVADAGVSYVADSTAIIIATGAAISVIERVTFTRAAVASTSWAWIVRVWA